MAIFPSHSLSPVPSLPPFPSPYPFTHFLPPFNGRNDYLLVTTYCCVFHFHAPVVTSVLNYLPMQVFPLVRGERRVREREGRGIAALPLTLVLSRLSLFSPSICSSPQPSPYVLLPGRHRRAHLLTSTTGPPHLKTLASFLRLT